MRTTQKTIFSQCRSLLRLDCRVPSRSVVRKVTEKASLSLTRVDIILFLVGKLPTELRTDGKVLYAEPLAKGRL